MPPAPTKPAPKAKGQPSKRRDMPTKPRRSEPAEGVERDDSLERRYRAQQARARERGEPETQSELDALERKETRAQVRGDLASQFSPLNAPAGSLGLGSMLAPLLVETVIITADEFISYHRWPVPSRFLAAFAVFGALSLASGSASRAASVTAWGLVLATTYAFVSSSPNIFSGIGNFFGGSPTSANPITTLPLQKPISQPIA